MRPDTHRPVLAALLLAASLLAGCAAGEPPASDAASAGIPAADSAVSAVSTPAPDAVSAPADDIAPPASAAGETARAAWPVPETGIDFAPIENFAPAGVVRAVRDDLRGAATADGFYAVAPRTDGSALLTFVDFAAKQHIVLCSQPNCTHNSDACPAWYARDNALRPYAVGGKLAVLQGGSYAGGDAVPQVDCMNADGSGRQTAFVFPASCWVSTLPHYHMAFDDENLYFVVVDSASGERQAILCAAHIPSGQVFALCGLPEDETHLIGGGDGALLLEYTPGINQSADAAPADTEVARLDLAGLQLTPLARYPFGSAQTACDGETLYLVPAAGGQLQALSLADGSLTGAADIALPEKCARIQQVCGVFDGRVVACAYTENANAPGEPRLFAYDPAAGGRTDLPYSYVDGSASSLPCLPLAESGDAILCLAGQDAAGGGRYALVSKAEFWAGSADMTPLPGPAA